MRTPSIRRHILTRPTTSPLSLISSSCSAGFGTCDLILTEWRDIHPASYCQKREDEKELVDSGKQLPHAPGMVLSEEIVSPRHAQEPSSVLGNA